MNLKKLLEHNPPYDERLAETVLEHYLRFFERRIAELLTLGYEREDIQQELRIALWKAWTRYNPDVSYPLRTWLSYKMDFTLRTLKQKALPQTRTQPLKE